MRFIQRKKILSFAILFCSTAAAFGQCTSNCLNLDSQIKGSLWPAYSSDSGIANVYALTTGAPLGPSLKPGSVIIFKAAHANTGASTTTVDGSSAISIVNIDGSSLSAGEIPVGGIITTIYDGVNLQLQGVTNSSAVTSPSTNTQYIYVPNCGSTGTTNNHLAKWGNNAVNNSCAVITATTDASTGIQVPLIGIVVSGGGTTGYAKIAIGGQASCQLDSLGGVTQGDSLQISSITAGDCEPIGSTPVAPANEDPETHFVYGLSDVAAAASSVITVDITPISPGYGNLGGANSPSVMQFLGSPAYGGTFAMPLSLYQMSSAPGSDISTGGFFRFMDQQGSIGQYYAKVGSCGGGGGLNCGLSGHDFLINNHDFGFSNHEQIRFENTTGYSTLDDEGSVSGTVNFYPWNGNTKKYTLTGNTTLVNNTAIAGEQRNPGTIFEFLIVNSGSFTLTVPADWHGFPTVTASTTTVAFCVAQSDNSLWCAGSSTGSGVTGSGTTNKLPKWTSSTALGDSAASDIVAEFSGCSGTQYLGADGACHTSSGANYQTVQQDGSPLTQRATLNLKNGTGTPVSCADNSGAGSTDCTISASGGSATNTSHIVPVSASPAITYAGMSFWFSADCITLSSGSACATPSNGTTINYWLDRSGNYNTAANQSGTCTFNTAQINSQPAVNFGASCTPNITLSNDLPWNYEVTAFAVVQLASTSGVSAIISGNTGSFAWELNGHSTVYQDVAEDNTAILSFASHTTDTSWHQINLTCGHDTNAAFRLDRAADTVGSSGNCGAVGRGFYLSIGWDNAGNTHKFNGKIAEIILYNRILSSTEITQVETYLNGKYGL